MKKLLFITIFAFIFGLTLSTSSFAHGMMDFSSSSPDNATIQSQQQEEQEGKQFLDSLNNKTVTCLQFKDTDFEKIGEYFMGQSIGNTSRHIVMNEMMKSMMGAQDEEQIHTAWGKRGSGCDMSATFPSQGESLLPMMQMMVGGWSSPSGFNQSNNSMMNFGSTPLGGFGWIFMVLWWTLIITGVVALIKWLTSQSRGNHKHEKSTLEILKERYAKGEINKKEFEEMKKDIT